MLRAIFFSLTIVPAFAQFRGLSTTNDGSQLYFSSALQLNGSIGENSYAKIFRYDSSGLHFVAQADRVAVPNGYPRLSNPYNLSDSYISGNGSVTGYVGYADCAGFQLCVSGPGISQTTLQYPGALFPTIIRSAWGCRACTATTPLSPRSSKPTSSSPSGAGSMIE